MWVGPVIRERQPQRLGAISIPERSAFVASPGDLGLHLGRMGGCVCWLSRACRSPLLREMLLPHVCSRCVCEPFLRHITNADLSPWCQSRGSALPALSWAVTSEVQHGAHTLRRANWQSSQASRHKLSRARPGQQCSHQCPLPSRPSECKGCLGNDTGFPIALAGVSELKRKKCVWLCWHFLWPIM